MQHPRIGPSILLSDGRVQLQLTGATGQGVRVQRSANLVDWEDWRTLTLDGTGCELIDETAAVSHRFLPRGRGPLRGDEMKVGTTD